MFNKDIQHPFCQTDVSGRHGLFQGNAMDLICDLDDHSVDLTILDPDYQDWDKLCEEGLICQAVRVTRLTGNIICFTKQPFDYELRNEVNHIFRREIIWSFSNGGAWVSKRMPLVSFQKIFWLTLSKEFYIDVRTGLDSSLICKLLLIILLYDLSLICETKSHSSSFSSKKIQS